MTFRRILCAVDFSEGSRQALWRAAQLAAEMDADLEIVHAWHVPPIAFAGEMAIYPGESIQDMIADARRGLDDVVGDATSLGARRVTSKLLQGVPWQAICEELGLGKFDLVVLGTHGRSGITRVLLGSVAATVVRHAPCTSLTIPQHADAAGFTHVLCPVDDSATCQLALDRAVELVRPGGRGITLAHVIEIPVAYTTEPVAADFARDLDRRAQELLEATAAKLRGRVDVPVRTMTRIGRPGKELVAALDADRTFDLVCMGSHGRTGIERVLLGSVAEKLVRHAHCPVLVARATRG